MRSSDALSDCKDVLQGYYMLGRFLSFCLLIVENVFLCYTKDILNENGIHLKVIKIEKYWKHDLG